jgi:hypothetical protein
MNNFKTILLLSAIFILTSCGGSSGDSNTTTNSNPGNKPFVPLTGIIGDFNGKFINPNTSWIKTDSTGTVNKTKAIRLVIKQNATHIQVMAWDGIGSTGLFVVNYSGPYTLSINPKNQILFSDYNGYNYGFKGLIGEKSFEIKNVGDHQTDPNKPAIPYSSHLTFTLTSKTTAHLRIHLKNMYFSNTYAYDDVFEGDFNIE